jgi:hypothetical protein
MSNAADKLLKRLEHLEKNFKINFSNLDKQLHKINCSYFLNLYHYIAREIKNEAELDLLKEYLVSTGQIDFPDFVKFKQENPLMKTYHDESKNALKVLDFYNSPECIPSKENQLFSYVNNSNQLILKKRLQIKKELLIDRGYAEDSKEVHNIEELIMSCNNNIKEKHYETPSFEEKQYYINKPDAEKIYDSYFIDKFDENITRVREIPLLKDVHFEPSCKALYFETISNYWIGNFNASIVLLSVFLEAYLKDKYRFKTKKDSDETLTPLINTCFTKKIISSDQRDFLLYFAETVRNNYIHVRNHKIIPEVTLPMAQIDFKSSSKPELTYGTSEEYPFLRDIAKIEKDKVDSKTLIIEVAKIVANISKSYNEYSEENVDMN